MSNILTTVDAFLCAAAIGILWYVGGYLFWVLLILNAAPVSEILLAVLWFVLILPLIFTASALLLAVTITLITD